MTERPIIFNSEMVRAILDGRKTQTRRIVKPKLIQPVEGAYFDKYNNGPQWNWWTHDNKQCLEQIVKCPFGKVGDRLWVREAFCCFDEDWRYPGRPHDIKEGPWRNILYCSDEPNSRKSKVLWRPSIHMPRWASRITLEITNIRVERLQDISEDDAKAEGVNTFTEDPNCLNRYRVGFEHIWQVIYGVDSRLSNPWVWAIDFLRIK